MLTTRRMTMVVTVAAAVLLSTTALGACSSSGSHTANSTNVGPPAAAITNTAPFHASGSIDQAYVIGAKPGDHLVLADTANRVVATGTADRLGSLVFPNLTPDLGYTVRHPVGKKVFGTARFTMLAETDVPPQSLYADQHLRQGLNYVRMRDGISLAMTVRLPAGKTLADGPFPTLVEYSGYQVAAPHDLLTSLETSLTGGSGAPASDPLLPATSTAVGSVVAPLLGFAVVSVQMRGSGCSGGAFDLFGLPTVYDGYDAIEAVAAQSWVKGGKVGMAGISFSGITQLFTAGTRPPHLAAIAPMSVTDDVYSGTGYPGGIFNDGFALSWIKERMSDAQPAPQGGQPYAKALVKAGDQQCLANQALRLQTIDALALIQQHPFRDPALFAKRAPSYWMSRIDVPVFLVGQFQDEQTGGHFIESLSKLNDDPNVWISLQNGVHSDSLGPTTITRWVEFLKLFVAHEVPKVPPTILGLSGSLYEFLADASSQPVQQSRFANTTSVTADLAVFRKDPRYRILFDNGADPSLAPGSIGAAWELDFSSWPPKNVQATSYALGTGAALTAAAVDGGPDASNTSAPPPAPSTVSWTPDGAARPAATLPGEGDTTAWLALPPYHWLPVAAGKGLGFTSSVLASDVVIAGPSSLDLYLKSTAPDTDVQVTISDVRPDGLETLVQSGWLRASHRKLDANASTVLDPVPTNLRADAANLPAGKYSLVRVPIYPVAYAFRAGDRIRITIQAPGGDRARWKFDTIDNGSATDTIALGGSMPSTLVLPVIPNAKAAIPLPPCPSDRGQPCRTFAPAGNGG
jgi:predicted acyl esterase